MFCEHIPGSHPLIKEQNEWPPSLFSLDNKWHNTFYIIYLLPLTFVNGYALFNS